MEINLEQIKREVAKAAKDMVLPDGAWIVAMRNCNYARDHYIPNIKRLKDKDKAFKEIEEVKKRGRPKQIK